MNKFTFTIETVTLLTNSQYDRYTAIYAAAREAVFAKLNRRDFEAALRGAVHNLGAATAVIGLALKYAGENAAEKAAVAGMNEKAGEAAEKARAKRAELKAAAEKAAEEKAAEKAAADVAGCNPLSLSPIQLAEKRAEKAAARRAAAAAELKAARAELKAARKQVQEETEKALQAARDLLALQAAKQEVAPVVAIARDIRPLKAGDASLAWKAQQAQRRAAKEAARLEKAARAKQAAETAPAAVVNG